MVATSSTCYDVVTFLSQRMYSCSNFVAISTLLVKLLKKGPGSVASGTPCIKRCFNSGCFDRIKAHGSLSLGKSGKLFVGCGRTNLIEHSRVNLHIKADSRTSTRTMWEVTVLQLEYRVQLTLRRRTTYIYVALWRSLTLRRLMPYIYGAPILDVSRSHTTTQHSR